MANHTTYVAENFQQSQQFRSREDIYFAGRKHQINPLQTTAMKRDTRI
jgi:hypothetical protein